MQNIIAVVGPTASGKTSLSIALAQHFGGEILSADSMQIYSEMAIGTAKPSAEERKGVPHHLMGHVSVEQTYNVASYAKDARTLLDELSGRNVLPIICGGTGLYIDHLLGNTDFFDIPIREEVRAEYQRLAEKKGNQYLYDLLSERDAPLAAHLHPNDSKRVIRGLEVLDITGRRLSDLQKESKRNSPYRVLYIGLDYKDRSKLYDRINLRVDLMMERGLLEEVRALLDRHNLSDTARGAIGYKELFACVQAGEDVEEAVALIKQRSRNYAKRQLTWFRRNPEMHWLYRDCYTDDELLDEAILLCEEFLKGEHR